MTEFELHGVQPLPVKSQGLRQHRIGTIHGVTAQGMPNRGEMHANLMGTSGLQIHGYQSGLMAETLQHIPMRNGRFAGRSHAEAEIGHFGAPDRCLNGCFVLFKTTLHERMIGFLYLMLGELPTHLGVRKVGLAHQHQAGSAYIKARNNALTPGRTIGSDMHAAVTQ